MSKVELRQQSLRSRKDKNVDLVSDVICNKIIDSNILEKYNNIGIYYPIKKEINLLKLISKYSNKSFYLPRINELNELEFSLFNNDLKDGPFSTKETTGPIYPISNLDCIIIPCVAISNNQRIGYGKGYYDKALALYKGYKIGICYNDAIYDELLDSHDLTLDIIITEGDKSNV